MSADADDPADADERNAESESNLWLPMVSGAGRTLPGVEIAVVEPDA